MQMSLSEGYDKRIFLSFKSVYFSSKCSAIFQPSSNRRLAAHLSNEKSPDESGKVVRRQRTDGKLHDQRVEQDITRNTISMSCVRIAATENTLKTG